MFLFQSVSKLNIYKYCFLILDGKYLKTPISEPIGNTDDQESYKREFFAMLEDVIKLSSDFPSVLLDPEFHLCGDTQKS